MKRKQKRNLLAAVLLLLAGVCASIGLMHLMEERNAGKEYEELQKEAAVESVKEPEQVVEDIEPSPEETEPESTEPKQVEIPIDFETLQEQNPDVYAWIRIPGTNVDYPVLQGGEDNAFYLSHNIDGESAVEGSIYTENYNSKTFTDPHTVIYGHNMKNGSMFRTLHNYEDKTFFDENREIYIYLPDQILEYRIFAAYIYDNRHLLLNFDFQDEEVYRQYLKEVFDIRDIRAHIDTTMEVGTEDRILTLSTCNAGIKTQRYLVQAVLISK